MTRRKSGASAPAAHDDGRQHVRLPKSYSVEARSLSLSGAGPDAIRSTVNDISKGGICIESPRPLSKDTAMQVRVNIPLLNKFSSSFFKVYENDAEQYFSAIAKTVWCKPSGGKYLVGLEFVNVDETQANALSALINKAMRETL